MPRSRYKKFITILVLLAAAAVAAIKYNEFLDGNASPVDVVIPSAIGIAAVLALFVLVILDG